MRYVCNECGEVRNSIIYTCSECGSREYTEVHADEICIECGCWHDHGAMGNFKCVDFERCFEACYSDGMMCQYMRKVWDEDERDDCEAWLNGCATRTLRAYMWELDVEHMRDFMRFVVEYEAGEKAEAVRLDAIVRPNREAAIA